MTVTVACRTLNKPSESLLEKTVSVHNLRCHGERSGHDFKSYHRVNLAFKLKQYFYQLLTIPTPYVKFRLVNETFQLLDIPDPRNLLLASRV